MHHLSALFISIRIIFGVILLTTFLVLTPGRNAYGKSDTAVTSQSLRMRENATGLEGAGTIDTNGSGSPRTLYTGPAARVTELEVENNGQQAILLVDAEIVGYGALITAWSGRHITMLRITNERMALPRLAPGRYLLRTLSADIRDYTFVIRQ